MAPPLLQLRGLGLSFGGKPLLDGADLSVEPGARIGLVGRNGSGKSTLLKIAAGLVDADAGEVFRDPKATIRYLPQEPDLKGYPTVIAYVTSALGPVDDPSRPAMLLEALGVDGNADPKTLSGGEARRAALAHVLAPDPDVLLLDEPTNHLDLPAIEWLEGELARARAAIVLISHDRRFLERLTRATVWLDRGQTRRMEQGFAGFEDWRDQVLAEEERSAHKLDRKIAMEEDWVRYGVTARRKRNMRRMRELQDMRTARREMRRAQGTVAFSTADAETSGKLVIEAEGISKSWPGVDGAPLAVVRDLSLRVMRGDRLGIVGPNGAGKTTLLNLLTGALAPDEGKVKLGTKLEIVTLDQRRESLAPDTTLADALTGGRGDQVAVGGEMRHVTGYLKDFLFQPNQARQPVKSLSGGERGRLMLARALARPANLLVLDEPTNDLDLETLDLLQDLLAEHPATVLLVSHDRDFLDRVATSVLMAEGNGRWVEYAGGYSDMVAQRGAGVTAKAAPRDSGRETGRDTAARAEQAAERPREKPRTAKLSFKQKHALETLPRRIEALQAEIAALQTALADPALFTRDPDGFAAKSKRLEAAQTDLDAAETEWLELELLREEIGG
ncbi:ABC-F family ATP-binding cassette domain-containing protein [Futiania mangrovi]|uniref:ATP-binding protein Uup n=1 Tax=Futiania mangrovi TaxID=2959716 RepID=A0A9J6PBR6_9PROT|nr:ATP-binding cassette domain-containing protein [Futiania mangrovii]MCP1335953.1 ATP-binding cassette domain-containing protein [Futiania mangrovii]